MFKDDPTTTTEAIEPPPMIGSGYKLRKKLADLDLRLKYPGLSRRWRRRMAAPSAAKADIPRGKQGVTKAERSEP